MVDYTRFKPITSIVFHTEDHFLAYSADGAALAVSRASTSPEGTIRILDAQTFQQRHLLEMNKRSAIDRVAFSPRDPNVLASGNEDGEVQLWNLQTLTSRLLGIHRLPVHGLAFNSKGDILASTGVENSITLWDVKKGDKIGELSDLGESFYALAFSRDDRLLVSACWDKTIKLWSVADRKLVKILKGHKKIATCFVFLKDGRTLASGGDDGTVMLWDTTSGRLIAAYKAQEILIWDLTLTADGRYLASAGASREGDAFFGDVIIWDIQQGKQATRFVAHKEDAYCIRFHPTQHQFVTAGLESSSEMEGTVKLWGILDSDNP